MSAQGSSGVDPVGGGSHRGRRRTFTQRAPTDRTEGLTEDPAFEHADLHEAIAVVLANGGPIEDELDAATEVMDLLVQRRLIPPRAEGDLSET